MAGRFLGAFLAFAAVAAPVVADATDSPPPFRDFTFRRVAPPAPEVGQERKRITIQIDPEEQARVLAPPKPTVRSEPERERATVPGPVDDPYTIFWAAISPRIQDASPARLEDALNALEAVEALRWPRLDHVRSITDRFGADILRETVGTKVSPALVAAVISVESAGRTDAVSSAGAAGLMQLMPATAERFGVKDREEAAQSIRGGVAYLDWLMNEFGRDPVLILAGYNAGEGAVRTHEGVPPYAETRAYVPKVLAAFRVASGLCLTPPMLISDPCVFVGPNG